MNLKTPEQPGVEAFSLPPVPTNPQGKLRKAGFELEYGGVSLQGASRIIRNLYGGRHVVHSTFEHEVVGTRLGDFSVEIDSSLLKEKRFEKPLRALGIDVGAIDTQGLEKLLADMFTTVVPFEIGAPPVPIDRLHELEALRRGLHACDAEGTRAALHYAFGMHINPEVADDDPAAVRDVLRAFLLLYPWLAERSKVDIARSIAPFIRPFEADYPRLIIRSDYAPDMPQLIEDYIRFNPTRNRPLDMLPLFAHFDRQRVERLMPDSRLVKPRPAFHYRLPNCMVDEPDWTLAREWNGWVEVERLACDRPRLEEMSREYLEADRQSVRPLYDKWPQVIRERMNIVS